MSARSAGLAFALVSAAVSVAAADPASPAHPRVAVLEYRAGAHSLPAIGERLAELLAGSAALDVVGPQEARRQVGAHVDADVARCAGEAACVAAIGRQLQATEVLLIGVSQLGDVVIAMQRIDTRKGEQSARMAELVAPDARPSEQQMLGWLRQLFPPGVFKRYGSILVHADVSGARVTFNDRPEGKTPLSDLISVRAPGTYRVRVTKPGYVAFQASIDVLPDATVEVRATLVREVQPLPWFKRWYVWAAVGGAVAVAGAAVAIYYGTRVDETPQLFIKPPSTAPLPGP